MKALAGILVIVILLLLSGIAGGIEAGTLTLLTALPGLLAAAACGLILGGIAKFLGYR